jgi:hypothetical protein
VDTNEIIGFAAFGLVIAFVFWTLQAVARASRGGAAGAAGRSIQDAIATARAAARRPIVPRPAPAAAPPPLRYAPRTAVTPPPASASQPAAPLLASFRGRANLLAAIVFSEALAPPVSLRRPDQR